MDEDEGYISRMSTDMIESPDRFTVEYDNGDFWEHNFVEPNNRLQNSLSPSLNKSLLKDVDCHTQTSCDHLDQNENLEHFYKESQLNRGIFEDKWLHPIFPQKLTFSIGRTLRVCPSDVVTSIPPSPRIALTMSVNQSTMSNPVPPAEVHPVSLTIGHLGSLSCLSPVVLLDDCKTSSLNCVRVVREVLTASQRLATGKKQATHEAKTASQKLSIGTKRGRPPKKAVESGEEPTGLEMDCTSYQFSAAVQQHTRKQTRLISNSRKSQTTNMPNVKTLSHLEPTASHMLDHDYGSTVTESHPSGTVRKRKAKKYPKKTKKQSVSPLSHIKNKKLTIHHKCISSLKLKNSQVKQKKRQVVISDSTNLNSRRSERQQNLQNRRPAHETKSTTAVSKTETRHGNSPEQNYVKISGRFQDDFVYFTAKHSRSSRRCMDILPVALTLPTTRRAPLKRTTHDFEWYHELSRIDKRLQFGSKDPCENKCSTDTEGNFEQDASNIHDINISDNCESEIVDLVMDMLPSLANPDTGGPMVTTLDTERIGGPLLLGPLLLDSSNHKADDINSIAEQVRGMLNSLGEAELEILESRLKTDSDSSQEMCNYSYPDDVKQTLTEVLAQGADKVQNDDALCEALEQGIDGVQNNITMSEVLEEGIDEVQSDSVEVDISLLMSSQASSNPVDLEDINASDLLTTSDAVNVNSILLDLQMPISQSIIGSFPVSKQDSVLASLVQPQPNIKVEPEDLRTSSVKIEATESDLRPNLTTVSLYWNDLPALVFNDGTEYVRLIDIHRQVLPAKDTSILRKRCSILGIATTTCSDMQRDFLVRYNNAANSKSTVVITKSAADMLIGYYFKDGKSSDWTFFVANNFQFCFRATRASTDNMTPCW